MRRISCGPGDAEDCRRHPLDETAVVSPEYLLTSSEVEFVPQLMLRTEENRMRWELKSVLILTLVLSGLATVGCGGKQYPTAVVTGRVMCGDKPAHGGVVTFQPVDAADMTGRPKGNPGGVSRATVQEDGTFRLTYEARGANAARDGAVPGPHVVTFIPPITKTPGLTAADREMSEENQASQKKYLATLPIYPKLDCGIEITPSNVEVKPGSNEFAFTLGGAPTSAVSRVGSSD
jgi:hypothetical protein